MADSSARLVGLSFIDRILDTEGSLTARIRAGLRRDLEDLMNTNPRVRGWPKHLSELDQSLLNFGVVDLATAKLATDDQRATVARAIKEKIRQWEPRLNNLEVSSLPNNDPADRRLRIRIQAEVVIDNSPQAMVLDTIIDPFSGAVSLKSAYSE